MYVCSLATLEETHRFAHLTCLCLQTRKRLLVKTPIKFLGSSPGDCGFCSSESQYDGRTAPRVNLLVSSRILQDQMSHIRKVVLGSSPGKYFFCNSETDDGRRT
jgi:hypothetical protein